MTIRNQNKNGVVSIFVILGFLVIGLIAIYLILNLPIIKFTKIKSFVDYVLILIVWIILQVGLIYGYYRLSVIGRRGWYLYKRKIQMGTINIKNFLIGRS